MKTRHEILRSKGYWLAKIQVELYQEIENFKKNNNINNTQLAEILGCSKGYVSQILNGDFDHKLSKFVELSLAVGKIPQISFDNVDEYIQNDSKVFSATVNSTPFVACIINDNYDLAA